MITEDHSVGDGAADEELGEFKDSGLSVRRCFAIYLITRKDHQVGFFTVKDQADEVEGTRVGVAFAAVICRRFSIAANTKASGEMEIRDLEDFEFAVFIDAKHRCFDRGWGAATNAEAGFLIVARIGEKKSLVADFPAWSRFNSIRAEENVYCCDRFLGIGGMPF